MTSKFAWQSCGMRLIAPQSCEPEPDNLSRVALAVTMITLRTESAMPGAVRSRRVVAAGRRMAGLVRGVVDVPCAAEGSHPGHGRDDRGGRVLVERTFVRSPPAS